jgi:hypothetical protein
VLRLDAVLTGLLALVLLSGTWDALYAALDLPHMGPALLAQLGGAGLVGFAYLLWVGPRSLELARAVGLAASLASALGAIIIAAWLIFRTNAQMAIGMQGAVELAIVAVVLAVLAVLQARVAASAGAGAAAPAGPSRP